MAVKVGSFAKSTSAAPVDQAITGVGFKPRYVMFWTAGNTAADTLADNFHWGQGFAGRDAADAITQGCIAAASQDNVADLNASQHISANAIALVEWGESLLATGSLKSFDTDGFTLTWSVNAGSAYLINYMAVGGADVTAAKVINWQVSASTGNQAVTGAGFTPDCVLHLMTGATSALPQTIASAYPCFGIMADDGTQVVQSFMERDAYSSGLGKAYISTDYCLHKFTNNALTDILGAYTSMDADGFTVNLSSAGAGEQVVSLCLDGGSYNVGSFTRSASSTTPLDHSITGVGFRPDGLVLINNKASSIGGAVNETQNYLSASDGTNDRTAMAYSDTSSTMDTKSYTDDDKLGVTHAGDMSAVIWAADLKTFDADGFTLTWTTVSSTVNRPYVYFASSTGAAAAATARNQVIWI